MKDFRDVSIGHFWEKGSLFRNKVAVRDVKRGRKLARKVVAPCKLGVSVKVGKSSCAFRTRAEMNLFAAPFSLPRLSLAACSLRLDEILGTQGQVSIETSYLPRCVSSTQLPR